MTMSHEALCLRLIRAVFWSVGQYHRLPLGMSFERVQLVAQTQFRLAIERLFFSCMILLLRLSFTCDVRTHVLHARHVRKNGFATMQGTSFLSRVPDARGRR